MRATAAPSRLVSLCQRAGYDFGYENLGNGKTYTPVLCVKHCKIPH